MAYTPDTLSAVVSPIGNTPRLWFYTMAAEADATIVGSGYFSDGFTKGMKVGDIVWAFGSTGPKFKAYQVTVSSSSTLAATVAAPTAIT